MKSVFWFRRDLRLTDNEALAVATQESSELFAIATADTVGTPFASLSEVRKNSLRSSWNHLNDSLSGKLLILLNPNELVDFAKAQGIQRVYVTGAFDTNGRRELLAVKSDLEKINVHLLVHGSNYVVTPGTVLKGDGTPYRVYTPFYNEWLKHLSLKEFVKAGAASFEAPPTFQTKFEPELELGRETIAGEQQAAVTLKRFLRNRVSCYHEERNRADLGGTSHLSHALSHGEIHPRQILRALGTGDGETVFTKEIAWREFYADVLWNNPETLSDYLNPTFAKMRYDAPDQKFVAWKQGKTGYPMVDAGMRQLITTGWMHNRVRMIVASFLVKDLHLEWQLGAEWFEQNLTDFDPASNSHGWQWTAGCGTDASPYYRIFNPVMQGLKFDPNGVYVRKFIPELRHLQDATAHEPWDQANGYSNGYAKRIVDHVAERNESLARLEELKSFR